MEKSSAEKKEIKIEELKKHAEEKGCPVQKALYYVTEFLDGPMCGRCFPCSMGSYEAKIRLEKIAGGGGSGEDVMALKRIAGNMLESSFCKKGKDTAKFIVDWMASDVFDVHARGGCPSMECRALVEYRIVPGKCDACGLCMDACRRHAILGQKRKPYQSGYPSFEIRQKRCTKCADCRGVCPTGAIVVVNASFREPVGV